MRFIRDKTVLITGAANGLGLKITEELLQHDAKHVAILDLPDSNGETVVADLEERFGKGRVIFLTCDVTDKQRFISCFNKVVETFNGLDILINNAGILNDAQYERTIAVNFAAVVQGTVLALDFMGKHKGGKGGTIVNVSSIAGLNCLQYFPVYSGAKQAVIGFSRALKIRCEEIGVRILIFCPGRTDTCILQFSPDMFLDAIDGKEAVDVYKDRFKQSPENVAKGMIEVLENGKNGEVYVCENDKPPYLRDFPSSQNVR